MPKSTVADPNSRTPNKSQVDDRSLSPAQREAPVDVGYPESRWVHVVLPAYNEQDSLPPLIGSIHEVMAAYRIPYSVLVVDDGSQDNTAEVAKQLSASFPVELIRHSRNRGLAGAMQTGLNAAAKVSADNDIVITMDADNTHSPGLIVQMRRHIFEGCDLVIASRYQRGARVVGVPWHRNWISFGGRILFSCLFPIRGVRDFTCGFRAYRGSLLHRAKKRFGDRLIEEKGFSCMAEILLKMAKLKPIVREVPMVLRYDRKVGESKMAVGRTILQTIKMILRIRFSSD